MQRRCYNCFMEITYDKEKLKKTLEDVYLILKTPVCIFDRDFNSIVGVDAMSDYCKMIRCDDSRTSDCRNSDSQGCAKCAQTGQPFSYRCHANVFETVAPIKHENHILGYILFGQYRTDESEDDVLKYALEHDLDAQKFLSFYRKLPVLTQEQVNATSNILSHCILYFTLSDAITIQENKLAQLIKTYIKTNLQTKITADLLCKKFFISRGKLYSIFHQNFNSTVNDFVLKCKIDEAKNLLKKTTLSITEIAEKVGFSDYCYFIQRFKNDVGITPLRYRKTQIST